MKILKNLKNKRKHEVRRRASTYMYNQKITQKYFKEWIKLTYPDIQQLQSIKVKTSRC